MKNLNQNVCVFSLVTLLLAWGCSSPVTPPGGSEWSGPVTVNLQPPADLPADFAPDRVEIVLKNGNTTVNQILPNLTAAPAVFQKLKPGTWSVEVTVSQGTESLFSSRPLVYLASATSLKVTGTGAQATTVSLQQKKLFPVSSSLTSGTVAAGSVLQLANATPGAEIRYTVNGTLPTETSPLAGVAGQHPAINLNATGTLNLRLKAFKAGLSASPLLSLDFTVVSPAALSAAPVFTRQDNAADVFVTAAPGAQIFLTSDGTTPTGTNLFTAGKFTLPAGTTVLKAFAREAGKSDSQTVSMTFQYTTTPLPQLSPVTASVSNGATLLTTDTITLTHATADTTLYYTTDDTSPLSSVTRQTYSGPFSLPAGKLNLKLAASKAGWLDSAVTTLALQINPVTPIDTVVTPVFSPITASLYTDQSVTLATTTTGASIYYTVNGTDPTTGSAKYTGPFTLAAGTITVKAKAVATGLNDSAVASQTYTVTVKPQPTQVVAPVFGNPASITTATDIDLTTTTAGAEIRYTLGATVPTAASPLYDPAVKFRLPEGTTQVNAIALKAGMTTSTVTTATFTVTKAYTGGILVHVYGYTHAHYWAAVPAGSVANTTWPGKAMTPNPTKPGWYDLELPGVTSINFVFSNNGASQTPDLVGILAGERWYKNGWTAPVIDDFTPPTVKLTAPAAASTVTGTVTLTSTPADNIGVVRVEYFCDTVSLGSVTAAPWSLAWNSALVANGSKTVKVMAYDAAGNSAADSVLVTTSNANLPPVANAGPDQTVLAGSTVKFNAGSSYDPNGTIASYSWTGGLTGVSPTKAYPSVGTYTVTLTVTDNAGATATDTVVITVVDKLARSDMREESVYFILPARFYDGDSSNNRYSNADKNSGNKTNGDPSWRGDFKGLIAKLDYIKAMGFSAIWLTPPVLNRSDMDYHGYHAWDMTKIDPRLESAGATYQDFINAAHAKGIKVIQDIVVNHSSKYGEKNFGGRYLWGDDTDPDWGAKAKGGKADYYDTKNPDFVYDGLSIEPISGKNTYNGDTWTKAKPVLPWDPTNPINGWGTKTQWKSPEGWSIWNYQWSEGAYNILNPKYYHTTSLLNWEDYTCQSGTLHPDCVDLNTESTDVQNYLIDTYNRYIDMGVDGFRIDTAKHVSRVMFNRHFLPAWKQRGGENFYMVGEVLTKIYEVWNKGVAPLSAPFYTWKERKTYSADDVLAAKEGYDYENNMGTGSQPTSQNAFLNGNNYRPIDYSQKSGMDVIDCRMHVNFANANSAFNVRGDDQYYNDATWNMVYVDSHDYGPSTSENRFAGGTDTWAENFTLMFTFRGIPTVYYGSEIEFKAGLPLGFDPNKLPLENSGRAYYGANLEGSVTATDFGKWTGATGALASTMSKPLVAQIARLNQIRRAIPALQKGQYSTEGCSGNIAFKRRFTDLAKGVDSFVLVAISGSATFTGVPNGTYTDAVTGDVQTVTSGTLTANATGSGNLRAYVLSTAQTPAPGKIGTATNWIK